MKKEIKFSAKLDSAEFDRSVEQMQRKLKEIYAPADAIRQQQMMSGRMDQMGMPGMMSKPSQDAYMRATQQSRREVDQLLAQEVKRQDELSKRIEKRTEKLKELKQLQKDMVKGSEDELAVKEKISKMEQNNYRLREIERGRAQAIGQTMDIKEQMSPRGFTRLSEAYSEGGVRGMASAGMQMMKSMGPAEIIKIVGGALVMAGAVAKVGADIYAGYKQAPISIASGYGSAMQGVLGREAAAAYQGRSAIEMAFLPEKQKAMQMAAEAMKGQRMADKADLMTSPFSGGVGATLKGAALGGLVGGIPGAVVGGVAGFGLNAMSNVSQDPRRRALAMSPFSDTFNAEYESMIAKDFAARYGEALQGLKDQNPMKTLASEQYNSNYMRYLDSQRFLGLNNKGFHDRGGFRENAINAGFTDDMAMNASSAILGAGGSTSMARNSVLALQAGRQFNQTNAANVLGQLSGTLGGSESTRQAYVKMLAEGTRIGLDTSEYAEESRKMMEATASVVSKGQVTSGADADRLISQFSDFLANKTGQGIQTAKDAFDIYNQAGGEIGGARGVMRATGFINSPLLSKLDPFERAGLAGIKPDQLDENDDAIKGYARKLGVSPRQIIDEVLKINKQSFNMRKGTDDAMNKATNIRKRLSTLGTSQGELKLREHLETELQKANEEFSQGIAIDFPGISPQVRKSLVSGLTSGDSKATAQAFQDMQDQLSGKGPTGKAEDESVAGAAEGSRLVLENFRKFKDDLVPAAKSIEQFNIQLQKMVDIINKMPAADRAKAFSDMGFFNRPETQQQSGKVEK